LLRHVAAAGLYLGGEVTLALVGACEKRGLVVRQTELLSLESAGVVVRIGEHTMRLTEHENTANHVIKVEIDGLEVAQLILRRGALPAAVRTIDQLKTMGLPVFLLSSESEVRVKSLAQSLGLPLYGSELDTSGKIRFMDGLRRRGVKALYAGRLADEPEIALHAHCSVAVDPITSTKAISADMLLLGGRYGRLCGLIEGARRCGPDINRGTRMANIPNFLCVAGAFGGVLNGITSGIIANLGVLNVDRELRRKMVTINDPNPRSLTRLLR
jgi:cation transport ATPase